MYPSPGASASPHASCRARQACCERGPALERGCLAAEESSFHRWLPCAGTARQQRKAAARGSACSGKQRRCTPSQTGGGGDKAPKNAVSVSKQTYGPMCMSKPLLPL